MRHILTLKPNYDVTAVQKYFEDYMNRIIYDSSLLIHQNKTAYPLPSINNTTGFDGLFYRTGGNVSRRMEFYINKVFVDIYIQSLDIWQRKLRFDDIIAFKSHLNTYVPHNSNYFTSNVYVVFYQLIENESPYITKIYGQNRIFGSLKGNGNYLSKQNIIMDTKAFNSWGSQWIIDVFQKWGIALSSADRGVVWTPRNYKNLYRSVDNGGTVGGNSSIVGRKAYNTSTSSFVSYTSAMNIALWGWSIHHSNLNYDLVSIAEDYSLLHSVSLGHSILVIYHASNGNYHAIFVKPYSVDTIYINYIKDKNNYYLGFVRFSNESYPVIIKEIDLTGVSSDIYSNAIGPIWIGDMIKQSTRGYYATKGSSKIAIKLYLRNKTTNKITNLSNATIIGQNLHDIKQAYFVIR